MTKEKALTIGEVAIKTGLSERALRLYEKEGLVSPSRTQGGRRFYLFKDLDALARVCLFKKAGLTLAQIKTLIAGKGDLNRLVKAQLDALRLQQGQVEIAISLLSSVQSRLERGQSLDADTLCELIRTGEQSMQEDQWKKVLDRYYTPEEQARWRDRKLEAFKDFDQAAYTKAWEELNAKIEAALPLDPASNKAQAFVKEWNKLLEPFTKVATPEMVKSAGTLWDHMEEWDNEMKSPISREVWAFIKQAFRHASSA